MKKLKIALAQIDYRPAVILESHELIVEPIFTSIKEPHTSISRLSFEGSNKVTTNLREKYLSWLRAKVVSVIEKCNDLSVDLLVLPEYSIPLQLINDLCSLTKDKKICIVAGTHMVAKTEQQLPKGYPEIKNCIRYAMSPIISNGKIEKYTFKRNLAAEEHNNVKIPKENFLDSFEMDNYTLKVKICIEAVADQETLQECENSILAIPSLSRNVEPFRALQILAKYKEIPTIYVNGACYGGSLISGPYSLEGRHWFVEGNFSKPIPKNCEALVTATVNIDAVRHSAGTVLISPPIELNEVIPLLYKESEDDNKLIQLIEQCKKEQTIVPIENYADIKNALLKEVIKKLQSDERQGILDCETIKDNLDYVKINTCDFQQMTVKQVEEAANMLASRAQSGFSDEYYAITQERLYAFLNDQKKNINSIDYEFSNDKGLFRGRDSEKNSLSRFFDDPDQTLICINGLRGIGKSKLVNAIENEILPADSLWNIRQLRFSIGTGYNYIIDKMSYDLDLSYIETTGKAPNDIAVQYARQIKKYSPIILVIDDFHYCLNNNGYFTDQRVKDFFINLIDNIQEENVKIVLTSNRRIRESLQEAGNAIEVSKLNEDTIQSIISYCYKKIAKSTVVPKIEENLVKSAYGNPLAAILIAQLLVQKGGTDIELCGNEFKRYQEGLIKRIIEEIEFTSDEKELLKIVAVSKGEIHTEFIRKFYSQLFDCITTLSNRLIIENSQEKLRLHPLFREFFYSGMDTKERFDFHKRYAQYFEDMNNGKSVKQDPEILSNLIYHLGGSLQIDKLGCYKDRFIDELKPIADQFYRDKDYKNALKYYMMIYDTLGKVRYDILLRIAICYLLDDNNYNIDKSKDFFEQASHENSKAAFIWAEYSIALSNRRKYNKLAIDYAQNAEKICCENDYSFPWERAKIKFAFAKAYRYQNFDKAMEFCKEACELDDTNVYYLCTYADMLMKSKNYKVAEEYVKKANILQPHDKFLGQIKKKLADVNSSGQDERDNLVDIIVPVDDFEDENFK